MRSLSKKYIINSTSKKVWEALVDPKVIAKWGAGPAKMSEEIGDFSLWGGDIWGKNTKVDPGKILKQEWYSGNWDAPSLVTIKLTGKDEETAIDLAQSNIPDNEFKDISEGWDIYYFGEIKKLLE